MVWRLKACTIVLASCVFTVVPKYADILYILKGFNKFPYIKILCSFSNYLMACLVLSSFTCKRAFLLASERVYSFVFNVSDLYSWSAPFEFGSGHQLSCLECSWTFSVPQESCGELPRVTLSYHFQFVFYELFYHSTVAASAYQQCLPFDSSNFWFF
jgi:hypothetical protein